VDWVNDPVSGLTLFVVVAIAAACFALGQWSYRALRRAVRR
jgi:hypothetical protein